jgi:hypothetical protein
LKTGELDHSALGLAEGGQLGFLARVSHFWPILLGSLVAFTSGCRPDPAASPEAGGNAGATPSALTAPAPAESLSAGDAAVAVDGDYTAVLAELTQALRKFSFEQKRAPRSFDELVTAGYVTARPTPPPGQKFSVDAKSMQVVLAKP